MIAARPSALLPSSGAALRWVAGAAVRWVAVPAARRAAGAVLVLVWAAGCAGTRGAGSETAVVLTEVHSMAGASAETLVTWIADGRMRVAHRGGVAIVDERTGRFLLLDPASHTVRTMPLEEWEAKLRTAVRSAADSAGASEGGGTGRPDSVGAARPGETPGAGAGSEPPLLFELEGDGGRVLGYACRRYHVYTTRQLFPGEWEDVEQEIWVTGDLGLSPAAAAIYRRVFTSLDWIGLDAAVERPPGVALRSQVRRRPHPAVPPPPGSPPAGEDVETNEVVRIETRPAPAGIFEIPPGFQPAAKDEVAP